MHNSEKTILDFSKAKANEVSVIADYQKQRLDIWLEHLQTDSSGVYEHWNNHDQCKCCTHSLDQNQRRGV